MKKWSPAVVAVLVLASAAANAASDIEVARQALHDGVWDTALAAADMASTNAADRTAARLISLEALSRMDKDAEMRHRLSEWKDETDEHFRYWRARMQVRVLDFQQALRTLEKPFSDPTLALPVKCLNASILSAMGDKRGALALIESVNLDDKAGSTVDDARLIKGELLSEMGKVAESGKLLRPLAEHGGNAGVRLRAGYLLGFAEMADDATRTSGTARVRALLRAYPGDPLSVKAARAFADRLLAVGDAAGADDEYRRYLEIDPAAMTDPDILDRRGRAFFLLGRYSEAAGAFARAEQLSTNSATKASAAYRQAEALVAAGRFSEAASTFARSAAYGGEGAMRARFFAVDATERAGERERAERMYADLEKSGGAWGEKAKLRRAAMLAKSGRLDAAIKLYSGLIESNRLDAADLTDAYLGRGRACYREYRFQEAAEDFRKVAGRNPGLSDGMRFLEALCLFGAGKDIDAKAVAASLMNATKSDDLRADLMLWCAKYEYNHGKYEVARTYFETFASLRSGNMQAAEALLWAARCASALTDYSKAVELATQAANSASSNRTFFAETLLVQGEAVMELGRYAEAVQLFDRAATQAGSDETAFKSTMLKADALYAMGAGDTNRYEEAIAAYKAIPDGSAFNEDRRIEVAFKIARTLEKQRRTREAMDMYYRNVVLAYSEGAAKDVIYSGIVRTFFARAAFSLATYYEAAGNFRAAKEILDKVVATGISAAEEAKRRIGALEKKGGV